MPFDLKKIAEGFGLSEEAIKEAFRDGRWPPGLLENIILHYWGGGRLEPDYGGGYRLVRDGEYWRVRKLTKGGVAFCPQWMLGVGREFLATSFRRFITESQKGFIVVDITKFPEARMAVITNQTLLRWIEVGALGGSSGSLDYDSASKACEIWSSI